VELANASAQVRRLENDFLKHLRNAVNLLTAEQEESLVRRILKADLKRRLDAGFAAAPRALADRYRTWAAKYAITLGTLEAARDRAAAQVAAYLKDLGYA
jgi:type I restriction enzyme M protein